MTWLRLPTLVLALSLPLTSLPAPASASPLTSVWAAAKSKPKKKPKPASSEPDNSLSAAEAEEAREPVQAQAKVSADAGDHLAAAELLARKARELSDPILFLDAATAYKNAADSKRDRAPIALAVEEARIGLDILSFMQDARYDATWEVIPASQVSAEISRGRELIDACETLDEALQRESAAGSGDPPKPAREPTPKDGRGLIAAGSVFTVVGLGGLGLMGAGIAMGVDAQKTVEDPATYGDAFDEADAKGKRGNMFAIIGASVGAVGLITGVTLIAIGAKKRKKYREENPVAQLRLTPTFGQGRGGLTLTGRF